MSLPARPDRREFPSLARRPIRVLLDGVDYLPNIGTMFRLCDAFRVEPERRRLGERVTP